MTRRWIQTASLEIDEATGALLVETRPPVQFDGGTKTVNTVGAARKLVADPTPCRAVWVGARFDANGVSQNTKPVFVGDNASQNMPIPPADYVGRMIEIDDASKIYLRVGVSGEGLVFRIFV